MLKIEEEYATLKNVDDGAEIFVAITPMPIDEKLTSIQNKEEWDAFMGSMLGESLEFNRTNFNDMDVLIGHYNLRYENEMVKDLLYVMLIGKEYIYNYVYSADGTSSHKEQTHIGAILYTIKQS